jgi:hypothetical protein
MFPIETLYTALADCAARYGIEVQRAKLDDEMPGEFDGPTITLNRDYDAAERAFYLAHSIGTIAEWSLRPEQSQQVFRELRQANRQRNADQARLERALAAYLAFETTTWEYAVWLLQSTGQDAFAPAFTNFGRADMESMRIFHTTGKAPVWREFFTRWNDVVRRGERSVAPFVARPIPAFRAIPIPKQEIVQEDD